MPSEMGDLTLSAKGHPWQPSGLIVLKCSQVVGAPALASQCSSFSSVSAGEYSGCPELHSCAKVSPSSQNASTPSDAYQIGSDTLPLRSRNCASCEHLVATAAPYDGGIG